MKNKTCFIGIDPGKGGAIGCLYDNKIAHAHTPLAGKEYDIAKMVDLVKGANKVPVFAGSEDLFCVIEKVHAMPGQGVVSMFTFGYGFGLWVGIVASLRIPYILVAPQTWKKEMLKD